MALGLVNQSLESSVGKPYICPNLFPCFGFWFSSNGVYSTKTSWLCVYDFSQPEPWTGCAGDFVIWDYKK